MQNSKHIMNLLKAYNLFLSSLFLVAEPLRFGFFCLLKNKLGLISMIGLEINNAVVLNQKKILEKALTTNPDTEKAIRKLVRKVILEAREQVVNDIQFKDGDPRESAKAVRTVVFRRVIGANINIYNSRRAHGMTSYVPPRKGSTGRGGNRRARNERTQQIMSYDGKDRGFILRLLNVGTRKDRHIEFTSNEKRSNGQWPSVSKWSKNPNTGNRGSLEARHWFKDTAEPAMIKAIDNLSELIDDELDKILKKK